MKNILLLALMVIVCSCSQKPTPQELATECMMQHAYHPDQLKVLSCNAVLRPERTKCDTSYHIAAVDGIKDLRPYAWHDVQAVTYDSIRIATYYCPEHYYCAADIECMNDCGETIRSIGEVAVFPDGSAIMFRTYQNRYYKPTTDTTFAASGTLTDVRDCLDLHTESNGWVLRKMLIPFIAAK